MGLEIERRFLVDMSLWKPAGDGVEIRQGYLSAEPERTVRVRTKGEKGYLTIKGKNHGISRLEMEYEIPRSEADKLLDELCLKPLIEKKRYTEMHDGFMWEIDVFFGDNEGLVIAEVEIPEEETCLALPSWTSKEVSEDFRYANSSLIKKPFLTW